MKVLILGASGIIGQTMSLQIPDGVDPLFVCHTSRLPGFENFDLTDDYTAPREMLERLRPDVIVNLAGESRPDVVERDPAKYSYINTSVPTWLGLWTGKNQARFIQVSTQAVFSGNVPPYTPTSQRLPVNEYGYQKALVEDALVDRSHVTIIRPTFVLGVRPYAEVGRPNPFELMMQGQRMQVSDRWFSPSFAPDVASSIWDAVLDERSQVIHAGVPVRVSRYVIAKDLGLDAEPISHDSFSNLAPRPIDTTYAPGAVHRMDYLTGLKDCLARYREREKSAA